MHFSKMSDKSVALIDLVHLEESRQAVSTSAKAMSRPTT
jgi:hypothetical protein